MAIRMMVLVKRRQDLTLAEFRDGYENGHSRLAVRLFGHLWDEYRRNYVSAAFNFAGGDGVELPSLGYDAISEIVFPDADALAEMNRLAIEHQDEIKEDEERWFDRVHCWMVVCETITENLRDGATGQ